MLVTHSKLKARRWADVAYRELVPQSEHELLRLHPPVVRAPLTTRSKLFGPLPKRVQRVRQVPACLFQLADEKLDVLKKARELIARHSEIVAGGVENLLTTRNHFFHRLANHSRPGPAARVLGLSIGSVAPWIWVRRGSWKICSSVKRAVQVCKNSKACMAHNPAGAGSRVQIPPPQPTTPAVFRRAFACLRGRRPRGTGRRR